MKHHASTKKLGREKNVRQGLMRSLANNLIEHDKIKTTDAKAKALRPFIERIITIARDDSVQARRLVTRRLGDSVNINKLFSDISPKYTDRPGGYTRIVKLPNRAGDNSPQSIIEFV